jgi:fused signal recognition particle receptor
VTEPDGARPKEKRGWLGRWRQGRAAESPEAASVSPVVVETGQIPARVEAETLSGDERSDSAELSPPETPPTEASATSHALPQEIVETSAAESARVEVASEEPANASWFSRLRHGLSRSSSKLTSGITGLFTKRRLDDAALEELEELLISADLGVETASRLTRALAKSRFDQEVTPEEIRAALAEEIATILEPVAQTITLSDAHKPHVILVCGVNGSGKTTTIAKLAHLFHQLNLKVILAAGDTFRAAAIEQLQIWGDRVGCPVITRAAGSDAASLAFEAYGAAREQGADVLLIDTAGRLQNKAHLMAELQKIARVLKKLDERAPHDCVLVLDSTVGQNAHSQVQVFREMVNVTGLAVTKLDGSAKGGVVVALADRFRLPVYAIGVGEGMEDMRAFGARAFARSLLDLEE